MMSHFTRQQTSAICTLCHRQHRTTPVVSLLFESDSRKAMSTGETAPESTLPYPPVHNDKKFVVLTDW